MASESKGNLKSNSRNENSGSFPSAKTASMQAEQMISGFREVIEPVTVSHGYVASMVLVAFALAVLLAVYLSIVFSMGGLVVMAMYRMIQNLGNGQLSVGGLIVLLIPWFLGLMFVLFLIKPLFAKSPEDDAAYTLDPEQEPQLFEFLERVCETVHAPAPSEVVVDCEVNASAGFAGWFGPITGRSRLTLGLPLIAGLNSQQLAGVIAHEFGHVSQRVAMRFSIFIRQVVHWLYRVAYERDVWDERLDRVIEDFHPFIAWPMRGVHLMVSGVRLLLSGFFIAGHFASLKLMREMEFNADLYEARLVGSRAFAGSTWRLFLLNRAARGADFDMHLAWQQKRLSDNYPALIAANVDQVNKRMLDEMAEELRKMETSIWDTHPCPNERVQAVNEENPSGVYTVQLPPTALFKNFNKLCQRTTIAWYRSMLGPKLKKENLVPSDKIIKEAKNRQENWLAWLRYFQGLLFPLRPMVLTSDEVRSIPEDEVQHAKESVMRLRRALFKGLNDSEKAYEKFHEHEDTKIRANRALVLIDCGIRIDAESFGFSHGSRGAVKEALRTAIEKQQALAPQLERFEALQKKRLITALSFLKTRGIGERIPNRAEKLKLVMEIISVGQTMMQALPSLVALNEDVNGFFWLLNTGIGPEDSEEFAERVIGKLDQVKYQVQDIRHITRDEKFPFEHARGSVTIAKFIFDDSPGIKEIGDALVTAEMVIDRTASLYYRLMEELSGIATEIESTFGLPPLPIPWKNPSSENLQEELDELAVIRSGRQE